MSKNRKLLILLCLTFALRPCEAKYQDELSKKRFSIRAGKSAVCPAVAKSLASWYTDASHKRWKIEKLEETNDKTDITLPDKFLGGRMEDFDFNNDGKKDVVFKYDNAGSYIRGTFFFVIFSDALPSYRESNRVSVVNIFPCQFDKAKPDSKRCPLLSQDYDEAGIYTSFENGVDVFFRGRYTQMNPIRFNGKTYIVLQSNSIPTEHYAAVIKPYGKTNFKSICLFKSHSRKS